MARERGCTEEGVAWGVSDVFVTSSEEASGTLHLFQGAAYDDSENSLMVGDAGWTLPGNESLLRFVSETRRFLGTPDASGRGSLRPAYNVVMWSWCGQVSKLFDEVFAHYFSGMDSLEAQYPGVTFVWMTGHLDGSGEVDLSLKVEHSEPLVGQIKTIAAWWLFAKLAGWNADPLAVQGVDVGNAQGKKTGYFDLLGRPKGGLVNFAR